MPHLWPSEPLIHLKLDVVDRACSVCGRKMHVCDHRRHPIYTLEGPRLLINRLVRCPDVLCAGHRYTVSPEAEAAIALPRSFIGWDLFCWIGHRRFARHYCQNHFLRDVAKPVLELDSHAKVQMRSKVRGLRAIEREALADGLAATTADPVEVNLAEATPAIPEEPVVASQPPATDASAVVRDYCTTIKGILNDDQGGPLHPPGLRLASALEEVQQSLERNIQTKKGGALKTNCSVWLAVSSGD